MLLFAGFGGFDGGFTITGLDTLGPDPLIEGVLILLPGLEVC